MNDSIFTKMIKGEVSCHRIYEDERTFVFLDIRPANEGHVMVIPKRQVAFVWDLADDDYDALMTTVKKIALHLRTKTGMTYVGSTIVGVDVPHAHIHLIPFSHVNQFYTICRDRDLASDDQLARVADALRLS